MVDKVATPGRNIIDFANYQRTQRVGQAPTMSGQFCRHCGAPLFEGDSEDDCSSAGLSLQGPGRSRPPRRFRAD